MRDSSLGQDARSVCCGMIKSGPPHLYLLFFTLEAWTQEEKKRASAPSHQNPFSGKKKAHKLDIFENPYGPPDPRGPKTPRQQKRNSQKPENPRLSPKVNARSPKVNARSLKVNARSLKVNVKYFKGMFEEFLLFEFFCSGVTVTGVSKISNT